MYSTYKICCRYIRNMCTVYKFILTVYIINSLWRKTRDEITFRQHGKTHWCALLNRKTSTNNYGKCALIRWTWAKSNRNSDTKSQIYAKLFLFFVFYGSCSFKVNNKDNFLAKIKIISRIKCTSYHNDHSISINIRVKNSQLSSVHWRSSASCICT